METNITQCQNSEVSESPVSDHDEVGPLISYDYSRSKSQIFLLVLLADQVLPGNLVLEPAKVGPPCWEVSCSGFYWQFCDS